MMLKNSVKQILEMEGMSSERAIRNINSVMNLKKKCVIWSYNKNASENLPFRGVCVLNY